LKAVSVHPSSDGHRAPSACVRYGLAACRTRASPESTQVSPFAETGDCVVQGDAREMNEAATISAAPVRKRIPLTAFALGPSFPPVGSRTLAPAHFQHQAPHPLVSARARTHRPAR